MIAVQSRQFLSLITTTGADCHVSVSYQDSGLGRGHARNAVTVTTAAVATPGTTILAGPDSAQASWEVETIIVNNIDTTSQTVTVCLVSTDDAGTQTVVKLYTETLAAGQQLVYGNGAFALATHNTIGIWSTFTAPADVTNQTADVLGTVTGLSAPVLSGLVYEFEAQCPYTSGATTTGVRFVTNGPAITNLSGTSQSPLSATTQTLNWFTAHGIPAAANADTLAAGGMGLVKGTFKPSADGTLSIEFASENNAQVVTVLAGATLKIRRVL